PGKDKSRPGCRPVGCGPTNGKTPLLYALHSGNLYGTERMALATLVEMSNTCSPVLLAPPGPIHAEAPLYGVNSLSFASERELAALLRSVLARHRRFAFIATGVVHSLILLAWNLLYRRDVAHVHLVHGGSEETQSYGRKRWLKRAGVVFVAVSNF